MLPADQPWLATNAFGVLPAPTARPKGQSGGRNAWTPDFYATMVGAPSAGAGVVFAFGVYTATNLNSPAWGSSSSEVFALFGAMFSAFLAGAATVHIGAKAGQDSFHRIEIQANEPPGRKGADRGGHQTSAGRSGLPVDLWTRTPTGDTEPLSPERTAWRRQPARGRAAGRSGRCAGRTIAPLQLAPLGNTLLEAGRGVGAQTVTLAMAEPWGHGSRQWTSPLDRPGGVRVVALAVRQLRQLPDLS